MGNIVSNDIIFENAHLLESFLNDDMLKKFGKLHNIKDDYNRLSVKQEMIAKRGYFTDVKKKYALHIVNDGGVDKNELLTRGLITRRSDYPMITKKRITELLNLILMKETINIKDIRKFIEDTEKELRQLCLEKSKLIARPVSYSSDDKQYKKVPTHVLSMLWFNKLCYDAFKPGTKGYMYRIKGLDLTKLTEIAKVHCSDFLATSPKYMVIPYEEEKLPDMFEIDMEASIQFSWKDRVTELLGPIMGNIYPERNNNKIVTF